MLLSKMKTNFGLIKWRSEFWISRLSKPAMLHTPTSKLGFSYNKDTQNSAKNTGNKIQTIQSRARCTVTHNVAHIRHKRKNELLKPWCSTAQETKWWLLLQPHLGSILSDMFLVTFTKREENRQDRSGCKGDLSWMSSVRAAMEPSK